MRNTALAIALLMLNGCASAPTAQPVNAPTTALNTERALPDVGSDAIMLSLSGGGARAASFSLGVLQQLRNTQAADGHPLLDHVAMITSVSGGSIIAAYYGLHGAPGLDTFRAAYLDRNWAGELHDNPVSPLNWMRVYRGGANGPDRLADWLDANVFDGAHMRDFHGPQIWLNAAELHTEAPFAFAPAYFDAICSDLASVRVGDAVAASMAVPLVFHPVLLEAHADACKTPLPAWVERAEADRGAPSLVRFTAQSFAAYRDASHMRYLNLADGGVIDNFGVTTFTVMRRVSETPYAPLSQQSAVRLRRMLFLVVNAERTREEQWQLSAAGPNGAQTLRAVTDTQIDLSKRLAYDAYMGAMQDWRRDLIAWRCGLSREEAAQLGAPEGWRCDDLAFSFDMISFADLAAAQYAALSQAPTRVSLPASTIDALIEGGHEAVRQDQVIQALTR
ncbi:MAG TPA: patatin-like phospholipase family protein [Caulobacterales bacterium]|nr:patatin-like phospholipase family protein [Caulobacterales bacterium]